MSVVDVQCHWYPREFFELLASRTDYPRCERTDSGYRFELAADMAIPVVDKFFDIDYQLEKSQAEGIDVLVSSTGSMAIDGLPLAEAREAAVLLNEARADVQRKHPKRFLGVATLPMGDPDAAIEVLDDACGRLALTGVCLTSNLNGHAIATEELRPVYARINELGQPLFLHPTRSVMADQLGRYGLDLSVGFMFDTSVAVLELVFSGLVEELADVPVVHPHLGATIPYLAGRINYQSARTAAPPLEQKPTDYLRRFYTDTVSASNPAVVQAAVDFYGVDHIMFASDHPFWDWEDSLGVVDAFTGADREAVLGGNAKRVLGLDV